MVDYAISAVSSTSEDDHLVESPADEVRFEDISSRGRDTWHSWGDIDSPDNPVVITQEPSSADAPEKTPVSPWADVGSRAVDGIDAVARYWQRTMKVMPSFADESGQASDTSTLQGSVKAFEKTMKKAAKLSGLFSLHQIRMRVITSIGEMWNRSISMLTRQ